MKTLHTCSEQDAGCVYCHRRTNTVRMTVDAVQLTIVFTIVPVIPFAVLEAHLVYGVWGSAATAMLFYGGYPSVFGALMWRSCTRKEGTR